MSNADKKIPVSKHGQYVIIYMVSVWCGIAFWAASIFPRYEVADDVGRILNLSHLWVAGAALCGVIFGLVLHRWMVVKLNDAPSENVIFSRPARYGKFLLTKSGLILLVGTIVLSLGYNWLRIVYYRTPLFGRIAGLKTSQPDSVREWTEKYLRANMDSELAISLAGYDIPRTGNSESEESEIELKEREAAQDILIDSAVNLAPEPLLSILDRDPDLRRKTCAAEVLGLICNRHANRSLCHALFLDRDLDFAAPMDNERRAVLKGAKPKWEGKIDNIVSSLTRAYTNGNDVTIRWNAGAALGCIGDSRAVRPIINVLQ